MFAVIGVNCGKDDVYKHVVVDKHERDEEDGVEAVHVVGWHPKYVCKFYRRHTLFTPPSSPGAIIWQKQKAK